jgi:hypothetical protein
VNTHSQAFHIIAGVLRLALVVALVAACWSIYRGLPVSDGPAVTLNGASQGAETSLLIVLRRQPDETRGALDIPVEMYRTDIASVWREYSSEPRPGVRFEDFLAQHLKGRPSVMTRLDQRGQATVTLAPGRWLVRALLSGPENVEWRLPVNIAGNRQTLELTPENSYARTKSF